MQPSEEAANRSLPVGTAVEVRNRFRGDWIHGFAIAETTTDGYLIRRVSDRSVLPKVIEGGDVRRAG